MFVNTLLGANVNIIKEKKKRMPPPPADDLL